MPTTRKTKPTRSTTVTTTTTYDGATLKSAFKKGVGNTPGGLKASKNVSASSLAAAKVILDGVVIEKKGKGKLVIKETVQETVEEVEVGKKGKKGKKMMAKSEAEDATTAMVQREFVEEAVEELKKAVKIAKKKGRVLKVSKLVEEVEEVEEEVITKPVKSTRGATSQGKKRKAEEAEEKAVEEEAPIPQGKAEEKNKPQEEQHAATSTAPVEPPSVFEDDSAGQAPPLTRARKRTKTQIDSSTPTTILDEIAPLEPAILVQADNDSEYENSPAEKAPRTPRKKSSTISTTKSKTPRSTRTSKLLSIAASTLGQTTLNLPSALATITASTNESTIAAPTSSSEATLSSLNTLLTAPKDKEEEKKRPAYLQHLTNLHAHLLTAIHLHHAQNGLTSLPDFKGLKPHLERLSRRNVELGDLRRVCWVTEFDTEEKDEVAAEAEAEEKVEEEADAGEPEGVKKGRKGKGAGKGKGKVVGRKTRKEVVVAKVSKGWLKTVDYGSGKIVLELVMSMAGVGQVNNLRKEFERRIDTLWKKHQQKEKDQEKDQGVELKEVDIPMAELFVTENKKMVETVLNAKGQRRLHEMKGVQVLRGTGKGVGDVPGFIGKKVVPANLATPVPSHPVPKTAQEKEESQGDENSKPTSATLKKASLLDRIRAKHQASLLLAASSPDAALSPEEVAHKHARICAQQRLPEVIPILRSLRLRASGSGIGGRGTGRKSMSMEEVVLGIRQSVRTGITMEEAELCVRLAGEWDGGNGAGANKVGGTVTKPGVEKGKGGLLAKWDAGTTGLTGLRNVRDEKGWVEVVEYGGVKAVVFK